MPARPRPSLRPPRSRVGKDVLDLVLKGWPNKRIASELSLSEATVKEHVSAILARLGMATRAQLIAQIGRSARSLPGAA